MELLKSELNSVASFQLLRSLLKANGLPYEDVKLSDSLFIGFSNLSGDLVACVGMEVYGHYGLLRSLAVDPALRGKKIGQELVQEIVLKGKTSGILQVFLLTETAHDFFMKLGFTDIQRSEVPELIKGSSEFSSVCPTSAACMSLLLS